MLSDRQCCGSYKKLICNVVLIRRGTTVLTSCGCPSDPTTTACSSGWTIIERGKMAVLAIINNSLYNSRDMEQILQFALAIFEGKQLFKV